jgi:hypothetical protein
MSRAEKNARLALAILALAPAACGGEEWAAYVPEKSDLPEDRAAALSYPEGPYGKATGDVIENLSFQAVYDPDLFCKPTAFHDLAESEGPRPLSLEDLYLGSPYCPQQKKFLWLISSTGT